MYKQKKRIEVTSEKNAFLEYISKFQVLPHIPSQMIELANGVFLIELFSLIEKFKVIGTFEQHPKTFSHNFTNLKMLHRSIQQYWNIQFRSEIESEEIDMVQIGHSGSPIELQKLLSLFVKTAARSPNKGFFIERILQTSQQTQQFLKNIIQKSLHQQPESPRKEKEKRMIDRLLELDHENQKLQHMVNTICEEKEELQQKLKSNNELITEKSSEIQKLRGEISDQRSTPLKKRLFEASDANDRRDHQIESLKNQIIETNAHHQKQIQQYLKQIQKLNQKAYLYQKTKEDLELSQSIIQSNQVLLLQAQKIEQSLSQYKAQIMDKDNLIAILMEKMDNYDKRFIEMEKRQVQLRSEIERKNIQNGQLRHKLERSPQKVLQNHHNLYLEFPDIINTESDAYIETNKSLREELERSRVALEKTATELGTAKIELQSLRKYQEENKRLRQMLVEEKSYKGEEIDILIHSLYHLRKKMKEGANFKQRGALKIKNA